MLGFNLVGNVHVVVPVPTSSQNVSNRLPLSCKCFILVHTGPKQLTAPRLMTSEAVTAHV